MKKFEDYGLLGQIVIGSAVGIAIGYIMHLLRPILGI